MVLPSVGAILAILLAHGADPTPLDWDEALADLVKFAVTFLLIGVMSYPVLAPLLQPDSADPETENQKEDRVADPGPGSSAQSGRGVAGWIAAGLLLVLSMFWWLARASFVEVITQEPAVKENHAHAQEEGGQVAMWADFHAEVARIESGEVRIYLRDSYNRDIAGQYFEAMILPLEPFANGSPTPEGSPPSDKATEEDLKEYFSTELSLDGTYRFARLAREAKVYKIRITTQGWTSSLRFEFDETKGKSSLPIWCSTRK